ncbi:glycosyltransferase family 2 protein [Aerococcus urinaeequi]|uniref:glycosyltransferase family 2 protein n=1 Tax=Aerococcus urinaeequi TaxID=51665 RepID=UPI003D6B9B57
MNKLISIIVPVYNAEKFIKKTVNSILAQSYTNLELIIVDDGSIDNSANIIKAISDSRINYSYQENLGAPAARNNGLNNANGEWIMFFDADDIMKEEALAKIMSKTPGMDMVVGDYDKIDEYDHQISTNRMNKIISYLNSTDNKIENKYKYFSNIDPFPNCKIYKKSYLDQNSINFIDIRIGQDLNFYLQALGNYPKITLISEKICSYRVHKNSISTHVSAKILDILEVFDDIERRNLPLYQNEPSIIETLKYSHYSYQLYKVPRIAIKAQRIVVYNTLKKAFNKIDDKNIYQELILVNKKKVKIALLFSKIYTSNWYSNLMYEN